MMMKKISVSLTPHAIDALTLLVELGLDRFPHSADTELADAYAVVVAAAQEWHACIAQHAASAPETPEWDWTGLVH